MLHSTPDIILPDTLQLLKSLQDDESLNMFFLVGGTALALQIGHRFSIDLDLFCLEAFDTQTLSQHLSKYDLQISAIDKNTLLCVIDGVKTDFITHSYPLVEPLLEIEGLRLASIQDIAAMKLNAIAHSGQRLKDFIDIYCLLEIIPLQSMLHAYSKKYINSNLMIPLKGLTYFDDIDFEMDPPVLNREIPVKNLKVRLIESVNNPTKIFQ